MGTRYEDQPAEHWAGAESLDPTPVWKQYALVALLLLVGLVLVVIVAVAALAPQFVTPPALVPGDRLVLAAADVAGAARVPQRVGAPLLDDQRAFYLTKSRAGTYDAMLTYWLYDVTQTASACQVHVDASSTEVPRGLVADCGARGTYHFRADGGAADGQRGLDKYLVSVSGDRVIVNLSRVIQADQRTSAPVPTGIPQPQQTP